MKPGRHPFLFARAYRLAGLVFGVTPRTAWVDLDDSVLTIRYGPWRLRTPRSNIAGTELTGGFAFVKTAGPPHLSFADRGVSFTTNDRSALCIRFHDPVPGIDPLGLIAHPAATVSVLDPRLLAHQLEV